ncbi:MAG: magnesium transporter [Eubacteriales bacterium]|nr:magnesium transporter [Clostridiales bacterium]MDD6341781.1 magnesium transporter [Eubacteriales bacterium]MDD7393771.1 magnesium transporter [Eubacteriales bacterium]MDY3760425.1 magnesium transporter [Eubacteriales bacterium]
MTKEELSEFLERKDFKSIRASLEEMNPVDIASLLEDLPDNELAVTFRLIDKTAAAETFSYMDADQQQLLLTIFTNKEIKEVLDAMFTDDTVDLLEDMPANVVSRILANLGKEERKAVNEILRYPEDSAGSIMTTEFVDLRRHMTVNEAFSKIRSTGLDKETVYTCYVISNDRNLEGVITVLDMLMADGESRIEDIMDDNVISINTHADREQAAQMLSKYNFLALPVVDGENRLVGIVTFDDAVDVLTEEATEDIEKMAAILPSEKTYLKTGIFSTFKQRIPWLLLLMISATFTSMIITNFEEYLSSLVGGAVLIAFIPMLTDTGGNAGGQASVTIIRGLALGDIELRDWFRVLWKEIRVAVICGVTLAACNFVKLLLVDRLLLGNTGVNLSVDTVVCLTLIAAVLIAKIVGCLLPLLAKRLGFDPAVMASPFITTIVDALALLAYFGIALLVLPVTV